MKVPRSIAILAFLCAAIPGLTQAGPPETSDRLVVHEWGTFTSFSGSNGIPIGFRPNNDDLPGFVYSEAGEKYSKSARLERAGTVSMETPVLYFYADGERRVSVRVDFPRGWITDWYPFAIAPPVPDARPNTPGQSIRWDVQLLTGRENRLPLEKEKIHYYRARETDSLPLQAEVKRLENDGEALLRGAGLLRGGTIVQQEKFLFYRGVGTFPPPVAIRALGERKLRIKNASGQRLNGLVLVNVSGGAVGFQKVEPLEAGAEVVATLPANDSKAADLAKVMIEALIAQGLYEKEARAMVKTWDSAWFGEDGTRLLYLVPRAKTDELLPLKIEPKPTELVRVLVGRHDFLTPEDEAETDRRVQRARTARAEWEASEKVLQKLGRFAEQARQMAEKRTEPKTASRTP